MNILAIDTSTEVCSIAVSFAGKTVSRFYSGEKKNTEVILSMIDEAIEELQMTRQDIELICFTRGPGAFTGVRVATGIAQGLGLGLGVSVLPVSTLLLVALGMYFDHGTPQVTVINDARMNEVYCATYHFEPGVITEVVTEHIASPEEVSLPKKTGVVVGSGIDAYDLQSALESKGFECQSNRLPDAKYLITLLSQYSFMLSKAVMPDQAVPVYLRDNVAKKKQQR